jgi:hypothetical protein
LGAVARAFAHIPIRPAYAAKTEAIFLASQPQRQGAEHRLLREIRHVKPLTRQDVAVAKWIVVAPARRIEPLVHVEVNFQLHVFETSATWAANASVHGSLDREHSVRLAQLQRNPDRFGERDSLERLDRHLVGNHH